MESLVVLRLDSGSRGPVEGDIIGTDSVRASLSDSYALDAKSFWYRLRAAKMSLPRLTLFIRQFSADFIRTRRKTQPRLQLRMHLTVVARFAPQATQTAPQRSGGLPAVSCARSLRKLRDRAQLTASRQFTLSEERVPH